MMFKALAAGFFPYLNSKMCGAVSTELQEAVKYKRQLTHRCLSRANGRSMYF